MTSSSPPRRIHLNQDDAHFYRCHPLSDMTVAGLERLVDYYAQGSQLAGIAFCTNMQRALFDSDVWERMTDGYDFTKPDPQPGFPVGREARGLVELRKNGIDQFSVWLNRTRHHGLEAWLSMRMNDCHGLEGHGDWWAKDRVKASDQDHYHRHASEYWKANPHLRRAPWRFECSFESAFDYSHEEVRRHHLALILELFERYDMDGLELDWMRWGLMFAPGKEAQGRELLTGFIDQVNEARHRAEIRRGHRIALRHRVPPEPQTCHALGYDVPAWVERGAADEIILSSFGACANFDVPIPLWRRLVGPKTKLLALVQSTAFAYPGSQKTVNQHVMYGAASSALQRDADGVYLFNECYSESSYPKHLQTILNHIGSHDTLATLVRRHPVTYTHTHAPGETCRTQLPIPLQNNRRSFGRLAENITLRIFVGKKPAAARYILILGFAADAPAEAWAGMEVRINSQVAVTTTAPVYEDGTPPVSSWRTTLPEAARHVRYYETEAVLDDVNVVEFVPPPSTQGTLEWAEIQVIPTTRTS
ncbi:MAG: hypothetical protein ACAH89_13330 [Rariglobus sp.]